MRSDTILLRLVLAASIAAVGALAGAARAQVPGPGDGPGGALSLQSQLGAIPTMSPRAVAKASKLRTVRLTQLAGQAALGETREIICPETGCQQLVTLMMDKEPRAFMADIRFVGQGTYLALQSRSAAVGGVVEFTQGRPGPVFIKTSTAKQRVGFVVAPPGSLRRLDAANDGNTLASGNYYTRKREPDLVLQVEVGPAREP